MNYQGIQFTIIVMAKLPVPGRVKTRLHPVYGPVGAARIHLAMLECVLERLAGVFGVVGADLVLALDADAAVLDEAWQGAAGREVPASWRLLSQGAGDLGCRMAHVAGQLMSHDEASVQEEGAVVFFGVDSPDVPGEVLARLPAGMSGNTAMIGRVEDGGYWTIAACPWRDCLVRDIDWGTSRVYDQSIRAAGEGGFDGDELPSWFDVDHAKDVAALRVRLDDAGEPALRRLGDQLNNICKDVC